MEPVKIIARFRDNRIIKGFSQDFFPNKPSFHLNREIQVKSPDLVQIQMNDLKAVFFVKSFEGNPEYNARKIFKEGDKPSGRKVEVIFEDGEMMQGSVLGYNPQQAGFFLFPPDPENNNLRVFVVNAGVENFRYL